MDELEPRRCISAANHPPAPWEDELPQTQEGRGGTPAWTLAWAQAQAMAQAFATVAGDLALVLDAGGRVLAAAQGEESENGGWAQPWVGRHWGTLVSPCSRTKAERLLAQLVREGRARASEINLMTQDGRRIAMRFGGLQLGPAGPLLLVGRDLAAQTALQGRLLALQRELESSYWEATSGAARPEG